MNAYGKSVGTVALILNLDGGKGHPHGATVLRPGKCLRYGLNRRLGGPWNRHGRFGKKMSLAPAAIRTLDRPARSLVTISNTLSRLLSCQAIPTLCYERVLIVESHSISLLPISSNPLHLHGPYHSLTYFVQDLWTSITTLSFVVVVLIYFRGIPSSSATRSNVSIELFTRVSCYYTLQDTYMSSLLSITFEV